MRTAFRKLTAPRLRLEALEARDVPATFTVSNLNDTGAGSLRDAVTQANASVGVADTIVFNGVTGTITLTTGELQITDALTITGPGAAGLTLQAGANARIFNVDDTTGTAINVSISGLTLTGGNSAGSGGAIRTVENLTLTNAVITGNQSGGAGGGLYAKGNGSLTFVDSVVSNNKTTAGDGGGLYFNTTVGGNLTITGSTFSGNTAGDDGGALYANGGGNVTISNSTFSGNTATNNGGGLFFVVTGTVSITGSTISGNTAKNGRAGGLAVYLNSANTFTIQNSTVSGNSTVGDAGGIGVYAGAGSTANILNSTIAFNKAGTAGAGKGGGIAAGLNATGTVNIRNTILSDNDQQGPAANDFFRATAAGVGTVNANFSLFETAPIAGDINGTNTGNLVGVDPLLGALANNGGPTFTHLPQAGSPAINAGDTAFTTPPTTDQRGTGFARVVRGRLDIGAVEVQATLPAVVTAGPGSGGGSKVVVLNPDGSQKTSFDTFTGFTGGVRTATADVNNDGVADYIVGTGPGRATSVRVYNGVTLALIVEFAPFESTFTGGVYVAAGDINNDGFAEVIVTPDEGGGPVVAVYRGVNLAGGSAVELVRYFGIQDDAFRGGARAAVGDVTGDGVADIVVSAGFQGGPRIQIWDGTTIAAGVKPTTSLANFFAFEDTLRNGAFVAVGDVNGDGNADLIFGGGPGGGPRVRIANGKGVLTAGNFGTLDSTATGIPALTIANFISGDGNTRGGIRVSAANLDGDAFADVVTGGGDLQPATVIGYPGKTILGTTTPATLFSTTVFSTNNGVYVG